MAYQGYGRGLPPNSIYNTHKSFLPDFEPDITIFLSISPQEGLERAKHGGTKTLDRMESENISFHQRVFDGYKKLASENPLRFLQVEAVGSPEQIFDSVKTKLIDHPRWKACE
jgi:dTMP kinase